MGWAKVSWFRCTGSCQSCVGVPRRLAKPGLAPTVLAQSSYCRVTVSALWGNGSCDFVGNIVACPRSPERDSQGGRLFSTVESCWLAASGLEEGPSFVLASRCAESEGGVQSMGPGSGCLDPALPSHVSFLSVCVGPSVRSSCRWKRRPLPVAFSAFSSLIGKQWGSSQGDACPQSPQGLSLGSPVEMSFQVEVMAGIVAVVSIIY